jgi:hypothetical protein
MEGGAEREDIMSAPQAIVELVERFDRYHDAYRSGRYNETQVRREFIDPLFEGLGWDIANRHGYAEAYKDVIHEDAIKVGGATKAPDYCFRIGGTRKFFLEAKRPAMNLRQEASPAFQLRRYAWSAKLPLSILTDFEELSVYDCRIQPVKTDHAATARLFYLRYPDYIQRWDGIADIFSREAVLKGAFDAYAESTKSWRGTLEVDTAFLKEIESWRALLARHLVLRNPQLSQRQLNYTVQTTIDRIIFLRICEDRGIEEYGQLLTLLQGSQVYARLCDLFRRADERYNSGLFHFQQEKGRSEWPDELTLRLIIDDAPLKGVLRSIYYPDSPYEFSVLPANILGQVYEQFLGKVIRLTPGRRAVVEEKPEVRKAGGVYYTPTYVVEYIVSQTVGTLFAGKTPRQAARLTILDPACGSGSFLISAYQYLLDWYRDQYVADGPAKHVRVLYQGPGSDWRLTTAERKRILLTHIYGVDIDPQAVEVTKLSLLLKVLEGENQQTLMTQLRLFQERALPDLGRNIKCGNSLISTDFYESQQMNLLSEDERYRVNVFDWQTEFPDVRRASGFDAVIGNPPWGAEFGELELEYLRRRYRRVITRMIDSYIYFIDQAVQLAKANAPIGFVIPSTILNQADAKAVRDLLLTRGLSALINLGRDVFGTKVLNTSAILVSRPRTNYDSFVLQNLAGLPLQDRAVSLNSATITRWAEWGAIVRRDPHFTFFAGDSGPTALLDRLRREHLPLEGIIQGTIQRGVSPDVVAAHVISQAEAEALQLEQDRLRPSLSGAQIKRYHHWTADQFIIYTTRETRLQKFPNTAKHLARFKHLNTCKEVSEGKHPWWALHRPRDPRIFASPKFVGITTAKTIELIYDPDNSIYVTDAMYVFSLLPARQPESWAVMAILQSRLFLVLYRVANQGESRVIPQVKASKLQSLPYPVYEYPSLRVNELGRLCQVMCQLHRSIAVQTSHEQTLLQRQIHAMGRQIDHLVYELYGLTDDEISMVEAMPR